MHLDVDYTWKAGNFSSHIAFTLNAHAAGIHGRSGMGKTTLLKAIAGLIHPLSGHITLDNDILFDAERRIFIPPHRRRIGFVFQDTRLLPHWSVEKNLLAGTARHRDAPPPSYTMQDIVSLLDVQPLLERSVTDLSGGEKQRIAIGRALLSNPRLLLMDEPLAGLDRALKARILHYIALVNEAFRIPLLYVSHDPSELHHLTDHFIRIEDGHNG